MTAQHAGVDPGDRDVEPGFVVEADLGADPDLDAARAASETRAQMRRRQLLSAAARLMERDGSQAVSMQSVADEAGVSVGLIYRYFGGKDDLLLAVIVDVLETFAHRVHEAISAAGADPVDRLVAAFRAYCEVIDVHRHAAVLTYRESKSLTADGRRVIKRLELETSAPLRELIREGVDAEVFRCDNPDLVAYDLLLFAHAWALKHWAFQHSLTLAAYVDHQAALVLNALLEPRKRRSYTRYLTPGR